MLRVDAIRHAPAPPLTRPSPRPSNSHGRTARFAAGRLAIRPSSRDRKIFGLMLDCPLCYSTLYFPFICSQQWPVVRLH
jgi:hypothetical protein